MDTTANNQDTAQGSSGTEKPNFKLMILPVFFIIGFLATMIVIISFVIG